MQLGEVFRGSAALLNYQYMSSTRDADKESGFGPMAPEHNRVTNISAEQRHGVPRAHHERGAEEVRGAPCRRRRRPVWRGGAKLRLGRLQMRAETPSGRASARSCSLTSRARAPSGLTSTMRTAWAWVAVDPPDGQEEARGSCGKVNHVQESGGSPRDLGESA